MLDRLGRDVLNHVVERFVDQVLTPKHLFDDAAWGLAFAKPRDVQTAHGLPVRLIEIRLDLCLVKVDGEYRFSLRTLLGRDFHCLNHTPEVLYNMPPLGGNSPDDSSV